MEKILMSLKEVCEYTGWGETKVCSERKVREYQRRYL